MLMESFDKQAMTTKYSMTSVRIDMKARTRMGVVEKRGFA
jgi:hypothetical protein